MFVYVIVSTQLTANIQELTTFYGTHPQSINLMEGYNISQSKLQ